VVFTEYATHRAGVLSMLAQDDEPGSTRHGTPELCQQVGARRIQEMCVVHREDKRLIARTPADDVDQRLNQARLRRLIGVLGVQEEQSELVSKVPGQRLEARLDD
jgi:hypothetical protein